MKKISIMVMLFTLLLVLLNVSVSYADTILIDENFQNASALPSGWAIYNESYGQGLRPKDSIAFIAEPGNETNKILQFTSGKDGANGTIYSEIRILNASDVKDDTSKLVISYRLKASNMANLDTHFARFGTAFFRKVGDTSGSQAYHIVKTGTSTLSYTNSLGSNYTTLTTDGTAWHNVMCVVDFSADTVTPFIDGTQLTTIALTKDLDKFDYICIRPLLISGATADVVVSLDDVVVKRVPQLSVSAEVGSTTTDNEVPVVLNFSTPVKNATLSSGITVKNSVGTALTGLTYNLSADGKQVSVTFPRVSKTDDETYTIAVANTMKDDYGQTLSSNFEQTFVTQKVKQVSITGGLNLNINGATSLATATNITCTLTLQNEKETAESPMAIVASYDNDNKLLGVDFHEVSNIPAGGTSAEQTFTLGIAGGGTKKLKAFVWSDFVNMIPCSPCIEYPLNLISFADFEGSESIGTYWKDVYNLSVADLETSDVYEGTASGKVSEPTVNKGLCATGYYYDLKSQLLKSGAGTYTFSGFFKANNASSQMKIYIWVKDGSGNLLTSIFPKATSSVVGTNWTEYKNATVTITPAQITSIAAATSVTLNIFNDAKDATAIETIYFDNLFFGKN